MRTNFSWNHANKNNQPSLVGQSKPVSMSCKLCTQLGDFNSYILCLFYYVCLFFPSYQDAQKPVVRGNGHLGWILALQGRCVWAFLRTGRKKERKKEERKTYHVLTPTTALPLFLFPVPSFLFCRARLLPNPSSSHCSL